MRGQLQLIVVPFLHAQGFRGSLPVFKRIDDGNHQVLDIQFNKHGKSFAVNLSIVEGDEVFFKKPLSQLNLLRQQRLGTRKKRILQRANMDHWFRFLKGFVFYRQAYRQSAESVIALYALEADQIYQDLLAAIEQGVRCIHSKQIN